MVEVVISILGCNLLIPLDPDAYVSLTPGAVAADSNVVEVVISILGYNLVPFDTPQQAALRDALVAVVPLIAAPVRLPQRLGSCSAAGCPVLPPAPTGLLASAWSTSAPRVAALWHSLPAPYRGLAVPAGQSWVWRRWRGLDLQGLRRHCHW